MCRRGARTSGETDSGRRLLLSVAEEPQIGEDVQPEVFRQMRKRFVTHKVYGYLSERTGRKLAWGMLTGVRPTKLVMQKLESGKSEEENC